MTPNARFIELLQDIEPSPTTKSRAITAHENMRRYISQHETFRERHVKTFLSGSYKRDTAIRPRNKNGEIERPDVDIIVVTNHTLDASPIVVVNELYDTINTQEYPNNRKQNRSVGVFTSSADMDVVPIIEPFGDGGGFYIPDRILEEWLTTNPPEHTRWTTLKNDEASGRFKPLVKLFKWWRRHNMDEKRLKSRQPKGFVIECIVADCMDFYEAHYGKLFTNTLERIVSKYANSIALETTPYIQDRGVPESSVTSNIPFNEFKSFYDLIKKHAGKARQALEEEDDDVMTALWREIFGARFPSTQKSQTEKSLLSAPVLPGILPPTFPDYPVQPKKPAGFA